MRLNVKQMVGVTFLLLAILATQIPASFVQAVGNTADFEKDGNSIISYTGTASAVSVPNGITTICAESFSNHSEIKSLSLPVSVSIVENGAFRGCNGLEQVFLGGVETLESGAFSMCPNLTKVTFSDNLYQLGAGVFSGDTKLKSLDLKKNPNFIFSDGALYNKDKTKLYCVLSGRDEEYFKIPDSVTEVERYAFWGCDKLRSVELSSNLELIPEYAFSNCSRLENVMIPFSVRNIAAKAFEDCTSLRNITLPASVTQIHPTAFDGCDKVHIIAPEGTTAYEFAKALESTLSSRLETETVSQNTIGSLYQEKPKKEETGIDVTEDTTAVKKKRFDPSKPADVSDAEVSEYYAQDSADVFGKTRVVNNQAVVFFDNARQNQITEEEQKPAFECDSVIEDIFDHVLPFKAFYQSTILKKPELQKGFTHIDDLSFARSSIKAIRLPDGLESIGYGAFYHCDSLKDIDIPSSVKHIEPEAFEYTPYLKAFLSGPKDDPFLIVGDGVLVAYRGNDEKVNVPASVKSIAGGAFKNHPEIVVVDIPDTVSEIGEGAFEGCGSLSEITGMEGVSKIADRAFAECPVTKIHIPEEVTKIGLGAFSGSAAKSVIFLSASELPSISYEKTATRLENEVYRVSPFSQTEVAVVSDKIRDFDGTVLDKNLLGIKGLAVSILSDDQKTVKLVYCTKLPEEMSDSISIPESVLIDNQSYKIAQISPNAFSAYQTLSDWSDKTLNSIQLPATLGTIDDYEPGLNLGFSIDSIQTEDETENTEDEKKENGSDSDESKDGSTFDNIQIVNSSSYIGAEKSLANCLDDTQKYVLSISDAKDADKLKKAVESNYGPIVEGQLQTVGLEMIELRTKVPISLFGKQQMEIWLPVSDTMFDQDICIVTLKESGELQTIFGSKKKQDDTSYFVFRTNHFSDYGVYAGIGDVASLIRLESQKLLKKDDSPQTGEWLDPRWFLAIGLGCIGLFLLLHRKKVSA